MPAPRHLKIVFGGALVAEGKTDAWSCGFSMRAPVVAWQSGNMSQVALDDISADVNAFWTAVRGQFAASVGLDYVKANIVGSNGLYEDPAKTWRKDFTRVPGSNAGGISLPWHLATVVSLRTDAQRGLASKGRIYLPALGANLLTGGGNIDQGAMNVLGQGVASLIKNLNNWPGIDNPFGTESPEVAVMSEGGKFGSPTSRKVTGVRVGNRFDTQRRRNDDTPELYTNYPIPA